MVELDRKERKKEKEMVVNIFFNDFYFYVRDTERFNMLLKVIERKAFVKTVNIMC